MKKIISTLLSVVMISASFTTAMAAFTSETDPYISVASVTEIDSETYYNITFDEGMVDGDKYYELIVDMKNLPDLTFPNRTSGVRLGGINMNIYVDNFAALRNATLIEVDWGAENESIIAASASVNSINKSISIVKGAPSKLTDAFPTASKDAGLDVEGTLAGAFVIYIATSDAMNITSTSCNLGILTNGVGSANTTSSTNVEDGLKIAIGASEDNKREETYTKAFNVITIDSSYTKPFVRATVGTESKDYYLPSDVKGATKVQPFFKYNSADIDAGVTVTFDLGNRGSEDLVNVGSIVTE